MIFFGWIVYGVITSLVVYFLMPATVAGSLRLFIMLGLFLLIGGMDYIASIITKRNKKLRF